jgi:hypothetical protein
MSLMRKNFFLLAIALAVFLTSFIFSFRLISSQVTFGYDQARDAYEAYSIWHGHDLKILGPSSDVKGLNHGVLWYYFLAITYGVSQGDPEGAATIMLCLMFLVIPIFGAITYKITKNYEDSLMLISLYSLAPLCVTFSYWLSNPTLSLLITPPLLFLIWKYLKKQTSLLASLIGFGYGLLIQSDFAFAVLLFTVPLYIYFFKIKTKISNFLAFSLGLLVTLSTFILTYIKFNINLGQIALSFLVNNTGIGFSTGNSLISLIDSVVNIFAITFLPFPKLLVFALLVLCIYYRRKILAINNKLVTFLLIWLSGALFIFVFNHGSLDAPFLYGPFLFAGAVLISLVIKDFIKRRYAIYLILITIALFQMLLINSWTSKYFSPLSIQLANTTKFEKELIDYTYAQAKGKDFVVNSITSPLYINTTWSYLYEFYGKNKYGYLPYWGGRSQVGYLGNLVEKIPSNIALRYLIIEPQDGIQAEWKAKIIFDEDKISDIVEQKKIGNFEIQKRIVNLNKGVVIPPDILLSHPKVLSF